MKNKGKKKLGTDDYEAAYAEAFHDIDSNPLRNRTNKEKLEYTKSSTLRGTLGQLVHDFRRLNDMNSIGIMAEILELNTKEITDITDKCDKIWVGLGKLSLKGLIEVENKCKKKGLLSDIDDYIKKL